MEVTEESKLTAWPQQMKETEGFDNHIIPSFILRVGMAEVYSPECVDEVAKTYGLVPGLSLDPTNSGGFHKA